MMKTDVDLCAIARKVAGECLRIRPGENFWISCSDSFYYDFAQEMAMASIERGAYPYITMSSDAIARKKYDNSLDYLKKPAVFSPAIIEVADVMLHLGFPKDPLYLDGVSPSKLAAGAIGSRSYTEALLKRNQKRGNLRCSSFLYPTPEAADKYNIPYEEYHDLIWKAVDIDYQALSTRARELARILDEGSSVHIKTPDGTDLTFSIEGRHPLIDDGIMDQEDIDKNMYLQNLPTGEVYIAPVEDSATGTAVFQYNIFHGKPLVNFRVRFQEGRIVEMEADEGLDHYRDIMEKQTGEKYRIAELGIGLNPEVTRVTGELALDEKIIGTIHIATGENRMFDGGRNQSSIHWDMVMMNPQLTIDGKTIPLQ